MDLVSSSRNLPSRNRNQHQEAWSPSHPIAAHRQLPIRNESLLSDPHQGRVPPYSSDERLDLSRPTALPSARRQEGPGLGHGSRSHLVSPCINSQPSSHIAHGHQYQYQYHQYQHHQHQRHQYPHLQNTHRYTSQHKDSMNNKPALAPSSFSVNSSAENASPYRPSPFLPSLQSNLPAYSPLEINNTEESMDARPSSTNSPPTPLSSPRDGAGTTAGRESATPISEKNVAAFLARFPPQSALILTQPSSASLGTGGTHMPAYFSAPQPLLQNRTTEPLSSRSAPLSHNEAASEPADFYAYCLDRGNGMFTRLIPADTLPMMNNIPPLLASSYGMKVLPDPPLQTQPPTMPMHLARVGSHMFSSAASRHPMYTGPAPSSSAFGQPFGQPLGQPFGQRSGRKNKVYCSKWVHDGTCAFTQQGCKYKHEMPHDAKTQRDLGLFQGYPAWYKKWQQEQEQKQLQGPPSSSSTEMYSSAVPHGTHAIPPPLPSAHGQPATPIMMRAHVLDLASQPTPPFSEKSKGPGVLLGGSTGTPQAAPWPSTDQLADSFGRSFGFSDTGYAESHAQQAQQAQAAHLLAQHQYRQRPSSINNTPSSLASAADPAYHRSPSQTAGFYLGTAQAHLANPPPRDPGSRSLGDAAEYSAFGPICPPSSTMAFASPSQRGPGTGNPFEPFGSQGPSTGFGHNNSRG